MYESLGDLSLDLLRAFEAAARHRSFTAAAMELGTTQPAISQQIKRLEEQLAIRLFDRIYRGIELTDALQTQIRQVIRANTTPRHVPAKIIAVADIPRTISGKIVELAVRDVVHGRTVKNREALANPEALELYRGLPELGR